LTSGRNRIGRQKLVVRVGNSNPRGITPATSHISWSSVMRVPGSDGFPSNLLCQNASLTSTAHGAPDASSCGVSARPIAGAIPTAVIASAETTAPSMRSGSPAPM
jgi:hypothetical protein